MQEGASSSSPFPTYTPIILDGVSRLLTILQALQAEPLTPLLDQLCSCLWPNDDIASFDYELLQLNALPLQWVLLPPRILIALTVLFCELPFFTSRTLQGRLVQRSIKQGTMSNLLGYSLVFGWSGSVDTEELVCKVLSAAETSPVLSSINVPQWARLYYGLYLKRAQRYEDAFQSFQKLRERHQNHADTDPEVEVGRMELRNLAFINAVECMLSRSGGNMAFNNILAAHDVTLVVDFLAMSVDSGMLPMDDALKQLGQACYRGSSGDTFDKRAQEMCTYFESTPDLKYTPLHFLFLYNYGWHKHREHDEDRAFAIWNQVARLAQDKPDLLNCRKGTQFTFQLTGMFLMLRKPNEVLDILTELLDDSEDIPSADLSIIFMMMSMAAEMLQAYPLAIALTEQRQFADDHGPNTVHSSSIDAILVHQNRAEFFYMTGQLDKARDENRKAREVASQSDKTKDHFVSTLQFEASLDVKALDQDWVHGEAGFRISLEDARSKLDKALFTYEETSSNVFRGRSHKEEPIEIVKQRYTWIKEQKKAKVGDVFSEGVCLCRLYLHEFLVSRTVEPIQEARKVALELYQELDKLISRMNGSINSVVLDMATNISEIGSVLFMWVEPYKTYTYLVMHIIRIQTSVVETLDDTVAILSSNAYKAIFLGLIGHCCRHGRYDLALLWSQVSKSRALMSQLFCHPNMGGLPEFKPIISSKGNVEFHQNVENFVHNSIKKSFIAEGKNMTIIDYTFTPPGRILVNVMRAIPGFDGPLCKSVHVDIETVLDPDTLEFARKEYLRLSNELLKKPYSANGKQSPTDDVASEVPSRLVAGNVGRGQILSIVCQGLVASTQRLAAEAEDAMAKKEIIKVRAIMQELKKVFGHLYDILIRPLELKLDDPSNKNSSDMLLIIPDEDLGLLPFSALYNDKSGKFLLEEVPVAMAPSIAIANVCKEVYEMMAKMVSAPELVVGRATGYPVGWRDLRKANDEMQYVKDAFSSKGRCLQLEDEGENVKRNLLSEIKVASWLHFTVHGEVSEDYPRGSLLLGSGEDERLTAEDISQCGPLCARGVVLSACETGLGIVQGEGILGLVRAFILAGVPLVVVSSWKVPDALAARYMEALYKKLSEGKVGIAIAMQQASLELMKGNLQTKSVHLKGTRRTASQVIDPDILKVASFSCVGYPYVMLPTTLSCIAGHQAIEVSE